MKILHLVQNYFPSVGGTQTVIQEVSEGCTLRYGDDVTVFTTNAMNNPQQRDNQFLPVGDEIVNDVLVRRFRYWTGHRKVARVASSYAHRLHLPFNDYVAVLAGDPFSPGMLVATLRARPDVIGCMAFPYLHMYYPLYGRPDGPWAPVVLFGALHLHDDHVARPIVTAVNRAAGYVAFTEFERQVLIKNGAEPDRVHTIGLGVDMKQFEGADGAAIRKKYGIGDVPVVGFIGRQAQYKGPDTLIHAMATVWDRYPDTHLVIAGSRTNFSVELDALIAAMPADRRARVTVEHDFTDEEKPSWFAACDIVVSVSSQESFGLVFVEAWATGRPVIGGRIGAVECVIRDGEDGLLVPCADPPKLATAIEKLLADRPLRERMGRAGRAKVLTDHTWPIVVDRVRRLYERVANDWKGTS